MSLPWYIEELQFPAIWERLRGNDIVVAVLDSGIEPVDGFDRRRLRQVNAAGVEVRMEDTNGHGTRCASLIVSQEDRAPGLAPGAGLLAVRVHGAQGQPVTHRVAKGIRVALARGARVISCSFTLPDVSDELRNAVNAAIGARVPIVVSAGNRAHVRSPFPEAVHGMLIVGAHDRARDVLSDTREGPFVDLFAPGERLSVLDERGGLDRRWAGTSGAAAITAAVLALGASAPKADLARLITNLVDTARKKGGRRFLDPRAFLESFGVEID